MPPELLTEGPFKGWYRWRQLTEGRFQDTIGAVYFREAANGKIECRAATGREHSNMADMLHGGFVMAFVDQALFAIAAQQLTTQRAVTLSCHTDFVGAGRPGADIYADGEVTRETGSLLFIRGMARQEGPIASFSAILRKVAIKA